MSQTPTQQYTARDYQSTIEALIEMLQVQFPDGYWKKLLEQDVPRAMMACLAWMHEQDAFYFNRRWLNDYLVNADDRECVIAICKQLGYRLRPATAASVALRAYPQPVKPVAVVIPAGTTIPYKTTYFEFLEDVTVPAFKNYWPDETTDELIVATEGVTKTVTFVSDGTAWQKFVVPFESVIEGSLVVSVADEEWEEVESVVYVEGDALGRDVFTGDGTDGQQFQFALLNAVIGIDENDAVTVLVDGEEWIQVSVFTGGPHEFYLWQNADGETFVRFGAASAGAAPAVGAVIDVIYLISGAQKRYELSYSEKEQPTVTFGDDNTGRIPPIGSQVVVTCRVGGGVIGNVDIGEIDIEIQGYLGAAPDPDNGINPEATAVRVLNYERGTGGNPRETIDHAKEYAPRFAQANDRAVTKNDWEVLATTYYDYRYGAPAYAAAKLHQDVPESNQIDVALWSRDDNGRLTTAGISLKRAVQKYLQSRRLQCVYEEMVDGVTYYFDVLLSVSLKRNFYTTTVFSQLQTAVQTFFDSALVMPGRDVRINELFRRLNEVEGVYSLTVDNIIGTVLERQTATADGLTAQYSFLFTNPLGQALVPEAVSMEVGTQAANDDGAGVFVGDVDITGTNTVDYSTGKTTVTFSTIPLVGTTVIAEARYYAKLEWEEDLSLVLPGVNLVNRGADYKPIILRPAFGAGSAQHLNIYTPDYIPLPLIPGRTYLIGGFGGTGAGGNQLEAYDDGEGNIVGNVDPTVVNAIDYRIGHIQMKWNAVPYLTPSIGWGATLVEPTDGVRKDFTFTIAGWVPAGYPAPWYYQGVLLLDFSAGYAPWGVEAKFYVNWNSQIFGIYLDNRGDSYFSVSGGSGVLHFAVPPAAGTGPAFTLRAAPITNIVYSAFVFSVKTPGAPGHDQYLFADQDGHLYGTTPDAYPAARLEHSTGQIYARLTGTISGGRTILFSYDSRLQSNAKNIPVHANAIGTYGRTTIEELEEEVDL